MNNLYVAVGLPGSGKSSYFRALHRWSPKSVYLSTDEIREAFTGDVQDQSYNHMVYKFLYEMINSYSRFVQEYDIYVDSTMAKRADRVNMVQQAKDWGYRNITAVVFPTPLDICLQRNSLRDRVVPEEVILKMHERLTNHPPSKDEGWDHIIEIL